MSQEGGALEQAIRESAAEGAITALELHLPALMSRLTLPLDPNIRHSLEEAAARLKLPVYTVKERIREKRLLAIKDGKRTFVLEGDLIAYNQTLREHEQRKQEQESELTNDVSPRIASLLQDKPKVTKKRAA